MKKFLSIPFLTDKQNHAFYGLLIFGILSFFVPVVLGLFFTYLIAAFVEAIDKLSGKGQAEFLDFVYTIFLPTLLTISIAIFKSTNT